MRAIARLVRFVIFSTALLTLSSCCCCDPEVLGQFTEGMGENLQQEVEAKVKAETAKFEAEAKKAQAEAAKMQEAAKEMEAAAKETEPAAKTTEPAAEAKPQAPAGDRGGQFKDTKFDKQNLTGGTIKLDVDGNTKKITGRFLGQYYRKPFSLPLEGKLASDDTFEVTAKADDNDITIKGTHTGDTLEGKINGRVRGKAIDAKFDAARRK